MRAQAAVLFSSPFPFTSHCYIIIFMSDLKEARLEHLEKAAECLMVSSPAISAYLKAERKATVHNGEAQDCSSSNSLQSCNACGTILIAGWSCKRVDTPPNHKTGVSATRIRRNQQQTKMLSCSNCGAVAVTDIYRMSKMPKHSATHEIISATAAKKDSQPATLQPKQIEAKTANRRARNKKSSLKSMLTEQKIHNSNMSAGFGLELMDLMQR
jgi:hypothetical protein